jgi:hypothetical protein
MSSYSTFEKTVGAGTFAEKKLIDLLSSAGIPAAKNASTKKSEMLKWDIEGDLGGRKFTVEAKFDMMAAKTGNLAVEYFNVRQGKPSGIKATTADLWAVCLTDPMTAWVCRTADLREYFESVKPLRDIACGGDDNAAMRLWRKDDILPAVFHRIDHLPAADLTSLLKTLLETRP